MEPRGRRRDTLAALLALLVVEEVRDALGARAAHVAVARAAVIPAVPRRKNCPFLTFVRYKNDEQQPKKKLWLWLRRAGLGYPHGPLRPPRFF